MREGSERVRRKPNQRGGNGWGGALLSGASAPGRLRPHEADSVRILNSDSDLQSESELPPLKGDSRSSP